jgi:hypothetical protein
MGGLQRAGAQRVAQQPASREQQGREMDGLRHAAACPHLHPSPLQPANFPLAYRRVPSPSPQAAVAEYSSQAQQWAERVRQLEAAAAAGGSAGDAIARLAALQQRASEAEVAATSLQAENRALRSQVGGQLNERGGRWGWQAWVVLPASSFPPPSQPTCSDPSLPTNPAHQCPPLTHSRPPPPPAGV